MWKRVRNLRCSCLFRLASTGTEGQKSTKTPCKVSMDTRGMCTTKITLNTNAKQVMCTFFLAANDKAHPPHATLLSRWIKVSRETASKGVPLRDFFVKYNGGIAVITETHISYRQGMHAMILMHASTPSWIFFAFCELAALYHSLLRFVILEYSFCFI